MLGRKGTDVVVVAMGREVIPLRLSESLVSEGWHQRKEGKDLLPRIKIMIHAEEHQLHELVACSILGRSAKCMQLKADFVPTAEEYGPWKPASISDSSVYLPEGSPVTHTDTLIRNMDAVLATSLDPRLLCLAILPHDPPDLLLLFRWDALRRFASSIEAKANDLPLGPGRRKDARDSRLWWESELLNRTLGVRRGSRLD
jgi:hypothetical protein